MAMCANMLIAYKTRSDNGGFPQTLRHTADAVNHQLHNTPNGGSNRCCTSLTILPALGATSTPADSIRPITLDKQLERNNQYFNEPKPRPVGERLIKMLVRVRR